MSAIRVIAKMIGLLVDDGDLAHLDNGESVGGVLELIPGVDLQSLGIFRSQLLW